MLCELIEGVVFINNHWQAGPPPLPPPPQPSAPQNEPAVVMQQIISTDLDNFEDEQALPTNQAINQPPAEHAADDSPW